MTEFNGYKQFEIGARLRPFYLGPMQSAIFCREKVEWLKEFARTPEERAKLIHAIEPEEYVNIFYSKDAFTKHGIAAEDWIILIYSAMSAGCKYDRIPQDFDRDQVGFWLEDMEWNGSRRDEFIIFFYTLLFEKTKYNLEKKTAELERMKKISN